MTHPLPAAESLTVEFKSDLKRLPDGELVEALVCLANAEGGELWLGVEDDGTPTGLHADHVQLAGLPGLVAARTSPSVAVHPARAPEGCLLHGDSRLICAFMSRICAGLRPPETGNGRSRRGAPTKAGNSETGSPVTISRSRLRQLTCPRETPTC